MKKTQKQFIAVAVLLCGAIKSWAVSISADFDAYVAPSVLISNTTVGVALTGHVALAETSTGSTFTVWGSATGSNSTYSARILGDNTGSNLLELSSSKGSSAYNLMSQVSTTTARTLDEYWAVKARFSVAGGNGSLYLGLYADGAMTSLGGYDFNRLIVGGTNAAAAALALAIGNTGNATVVRTASNNKLEFWNGTGWSTSGSGAYAATGLDITGSTEYDFAVSTDGTTLTISLANAATSTTLFSVTSALSDLGTNITAANTARFSAGDIANNSTDGWVMTIQSLSLQPTRGSRSLILFKN